jgi:hypothetical protein
MTGRNERLVTARGSDSLMRNATTCQLARRLCCDASHAA